LKKFALLICLLTTIASGAEKARNVILFLADGTGIPTINAASIHGYGRPRALYIQNMPHIGLSETSSASSWVTDSAAGMTAIVTGKKTGNGILSQGPEAKRGVKDGAPLKTILEYAEEHGLATGVVSNSPMADATPAACYAHVNDRSKFGEIFAQVLQPRFGDGVDVIMGPGRAAIMKGTAVLGIDLAKALPAKGYLFLDTPQALSSINRETRRVVALWDSEEFDLAGVVDAAIRILSQNPKGFFLMVESNNHMTNVKQALERTVRMDNMIHAVTQKWKRNSLILFTADHSYDLRLPKGNIGEDILPLIRVDDHHTAEEVLIAAEGPGSDRVRGILPNTQLFHIMMAAYGWK